VLPQYESDTRGYQSDLRSGTPSQRQQGTPGNYVRAASQGRAGVSTSAGGVDLNQSGNSAMFEGVRPENSWQPTPRPVLDSPVPQSAPIAEGRIVPATDRARQGTAQGSEARSREELIDVRKLGGVLSRGLDAEGEARSRSHGEVIHSRRGHRAPVGILSLSRTRRRRCHSVRMG